jgi:alginate O-acetyltransferase complex protein AlgI
MLFSSATFVFGFLPLFLVGFFLLARFGRQIALTWAVLGSLVFYGWDDAVRLLPLISSSIAFNFVVGRSLARHNKLRSLVLGIGGNLALLAYFKYAQLFMDTFTSLGHSTAINLKIELPIGISFFTFTQIAFLVDTYRGHAQEYSVLKYAFFVTYFPHLIAGPILHHKEIIPQLDQKDTYRFQPNNLALGLSWFAIGLFKKVALADNVASFVAPAFDAVGTKAAISIGDAWTGTVSYALQIYFDFSGYSDMAIGLALTMGIVFPINFDSPYQATSLIDFWRRWHITLSRFLRDYLYIPLGGNRHGMLRRHVNIFITMLLGGFWHGASWNFMLWGAIHGIALVANHFWRGIGIALPRFVGQALTLLVVMIAWVPFRADSFSSTFVIWKAMFGSSGVPTVATNVTTALPWILALSAIALFAPNSQTLMSHPWMSYRQNWRPRWVPTARWAIVLGCMFGISVAASFGHTTYFLYFRF